MVIIGITGEEIRQKDKQWGPSMDGQSQTYVDAIVRAGGTPIILPVTSNVKVWEQYLQFCDGILFAGGADIQPALYGEQNHESVTDVAVDRDKQELYLIKKFLEKDKPLLAICRGMQLLNIADGGTLYQDIPSCLPNASNHRISSEKQDVTFLAHQLKIEPTSRLATILQTCSLGTNSHHHQAIKEPGHNCIITAHAEDGIIEAIELPEAYYAIGVQSHPESLGDAVPVWQRLFASFVQASANRNAAHFTTVTAE